MALKNKSVLMLVEEDFEDVELTEPLEALGKAGVEVTLVGSGSQNIYHGKRGKAQVKVDTTAGQVDVKKYDAVIIPGGYAPDKMRLHSEMVDLVRKANEAGKLIAAVCHGPQLLISANVVRGRRITSWPSVAVDLKNAGAFWVDEPVVRMTT